MALIEFRSLIGDVLFRARMPVPREDERVILPSPLLHCASGWRVVDIAYFLLGNGEIEKIAVYIKPWS